MSESIERGRTVARDAPSLAVVALGASAGGVRALREFFARVSRDGSAAYVVILHLSPAHESQLAEVLQAITAMPVTQVTEPTSIEADRIYVIAPHTVLELRGGLLTVSDMSAPEQRRGPIDAFFRSLAEAYGHQAVAVVLSGTGTDGSAGVKQIKECGGFVVAQDPEDAEYPDMPRHAIATGLVDVVLRTPEMPERLARFASGLRREVADAPSIEAIAVPDPIREVLSVLRARTGHDFSNYKPATLRRRIARRMAVRNTPTMEEYALLVREIREEPKLLMSDLLISVTSFFRDPAVWQALQQRIVPRVFLNKLPSDQVRVWVAGCATGEEAYSLAMLLAEHAAASIEGPSIQVFATDLDERAIAVARDGLYNEADVVDVPEERLKRFFHKEAEGYRIRRDLREFVLFATHNVLRDPPFSHLDLISCRNLLIYLNRAAQERVVETFHFALRPGRYLLLGGSESPEASGDLFVRIDTTAHVYESRTVTSRLALPVVDTPLLPLHGSLHVPERRTVERAWPADLHQRLLEQYAPPSVVVTEDHRVLHLSERAGRYMVLRGGEPTRDLLALVRPELRPHVRTVLHQAAAGRSPVEARDIEVALDDGVHRIDVCVRPVLRDSEPTVGFFLVLFTEKPAGSEPVDRAVPVTSGSEAVAQQLEEEIVRLNTQLRHIVEQYETQVEEAKATNEELQAMNEELRSAAEELETSKEELQSVNEELTTVNQELKIKLEELSLTNNNFQNLINAADVGTIFVDTALRVKFSTPRARTIFNLLDSDIGRPLTDITSRIQYPNVRADVEAVLQQLQTIEREVSSDDNRWYLMRMLPYRTGDNHIEGVVLTFQDITERRRGEQEVRESEERLRLLIDSALDYAMFTMSEEGVIDSWNAGAERMFGYSSEEIVGQSAHLLFTPEDRAASAFERELNEARRSGRSRDERIHLRKNGARFYCSGVTRRLGAGGIGFAKVARDLTVQRESQLALAAVRDTIETRVRDRTAQLRAEVEDYASAKAAVTTLLRRVVTAQEDERRRIARDLHDQLGQQLTALRLALERHQAANSYTANGAIDEALALTGRIGRDVDFLAWELRPAALDEIGLIAALPRFIAQWSAHVAIAAEFRLHGFEAGQLEPDAAVAYYRIAQEALNNIAKHAQASRVDVVLATTDGQVVLVVEDDGLGFEVTGEPHWDRGLGLASMQERAALGGAALDIESTPGQGTSVFVRRPIQPRNAGGDGDERG